MVIEQGAQSRKGGGVYRGYLIFLTFLLQLQRGSDLFNPQAASDVSVANQTEILWVQFFTHRDNHKVYSVVAPHCTQQDPGFEAASGLCESVPTPRQRISAEEPMECVDMDETALPDPGWKTFKSKELQAASVFLVGHLAMQVLAANSKPMVGSMVLLGALLCIGIIWILGWKTLKSKELQERKDFMKQKNRDPETRPKKIGRSCWFKSCGRSHRPACRDFRCVTTVGWPSGGYKLADPPWEDPLCHGTPFGTDPKLCESEPTSSPPTSSQPTSLLTTVLSSLCLLWVILRWFPLIRKAAPSLWKTIACRRISSKEPMECVDMVETADPGTTTAAELFYPFHLRSRACSASGRGTGGAGGTSSAVSLMLNPILLLTALVESALLGDQSWRIWVQVIGFLITACLLLCNFHLKSEKCKCLSLALVLLQLPIGCSFVEALVRCLCVWAFPMFPADDSEFDHSSWPSLERDFNYYIQSADPDEASGALENLWILLFENPSSATTLPEVPVAEGVLGAMLCHPRDEGVQQLGCMALHYLCRYFPSLREELRRRPLFLDTVRNAETVVPDFEEHFWYKEELCPWLQPFAEASQEEKEERELQEVLRRSVETAKEKEERELQEVLRRSAETAEEDPEHSSRMCCVCWQEPSSHVLIPCGHLCLCDRCAPNIHDGSNCPICRSTVQSKQKIYFA